MIDAITKITDEIVSIMDGKIYGIWLYGSIVMNDFQLGWSDIDFCALTDSTISEDQAKRLLFLRQEMLEREPDNLYYRSFEGIIANQCEYRNQAFGRLVYWGTSGQRITGTHVQDAFTRI